MEQPNNIQLEVFWESLGFTRHELADKETIKHYNERHLGDKWKTYTNLLNDYNNVIDLSRTQSGKKISEKLCKNGNHLFTHDIPYSLEDSFCTRCYMYNTTIGWGFADLNKLDLIFDAITWIRFHRVNWTNPITHNNTFNLPHLDMNELITYAFPKIESDYEIKIGDDSNMLGKSVCLINKSNRECSGASPIAYFLKWDELPIAIFKVFCVTKNINNEYTQ